MGIQFLYSREIVYHSCKALILLLIMTVSYCLIPNVFTASILDINNLP